MPEQPTQSLANYTRRDPLFHFFILPVLAITVGWAIVACARNPSALSVWLVLFTAAVLFGAFKTRLYALKVQDRVIRLEERLRLAALLPEQGRDCIPHLTESQLIALRFAADEELPELALRAATQHLPASEIKKSIRNWRPDFWRV